MILLQYKTDHRLQLAQVTTGKITFLVDLTTFEQSVNIDHVQEPFGRVKVSITDYKSLYKGRQQ